MKAAGLAAMLLGFSLAFAGCFSGASQDPEPDRQWLLEANLDARETPEELYQAALEEDVLRVYSNTTRMLEVKKTFEARYPGLVVDVVDIRGSDMLELLTKAHKEGESICDVMVCADNNGIISRELIPSGVVVKYAPWDLEEKILPMNNRDSLEFYNEAVVLFYNGEAHSRPPVDNWWELTEPLFRGRVYLSSPQKSLSTYALLSMMIQRSDLMAQAYEAHFGQPLDNPEDAGREFIRRLFGNDAVFVSSNDEIAQAVGAPGQEQPPVGIMVSSKVRMNDIGYSLSPHYGMQPFAGTHSTNSVMVVSGARNPNAAKLLIRWLLGESDGAGEGYLPYLQLGEWSARRDVKSLEPVPMAEIHLLELDKDYVYDHRESFEQFWLSALESQGAS